MLVSGTFGRRCPACRPPVSVAGSRSRPVDPDLDDRPPVHAMDIDMLRRGLEKTSRQLAEEITENRRLKKQAAPLSIERLFYAMPKDVQQKVSLHDLKRICDNINSENAEMKGAGKAASQNNE